MLKSVADSEVYSAALDDLEIYSLLKEMQAQHGEVADGPALQLQYLDSVIWQDHEKVQLYNK